MSKWYTIKELKEIANKYAVNYRELTDKNSKGRSCGGAYKMNVLNKLKACGKI